MALYFPLVADLCTAMDVSEAPVRLDLNRTDLKGFRGFWFQYFSSWSVVTDSGSASEFPTWLNLCLDFGDNLKQVCILGYEDGPLLSAALLLCFLICVCAHGHAAATYSYFSCQGRPSEVRAPCSNTGFARSHYRRSKHPCKRLTLSILHLEVRHSVVQKRDFLSHVGVASWVLLTCGVATIYF